MSARLEFFRNLRRFCSVIRISLPLLHVLGSIGLSNIEILPPDLNSPARVNLETADTWVNLGEGSVKSTVLSLRIAVTSKQ